MENPSPSELRLRSVGRVAASIGKHIFGVAIVLVSLGACGAMLLTGRGYP